MSTHLDGAPPSMADPDDGDPDDGDRVFSRPSSTTARTGCARRSQRRMAANRSTRGRHARRGDAAGRPGGAACPRRRRARHPARAGTAAPAASGRPAPTPGLRRRGRPARELRPAALRADPRARGGARRTGQRADPDRPPGRGDATTASTRRGAPLGGPSLPAHGMPLPVRKKRSGPGTPLQVDGTATGPWSRPSTSIVPNEPVQRLGAPPGCSGRRAAAPLGGSGLPTAGFPGRARRAADTGSAEVVETAVPDTDGARRTRTSLAAGDTVPTAQVADGPRTPSRIAGRRPARRALGGARRAGTRPGEHARADRAGPRRRPPPGDRDLAEATTTTLPVVGGGASAARPPRRDTGAAGVGPPQRRAPAGDPAPHPGRRHRAPGAGQHARAGGALRAQGRGPPGAHDQEVQEGTAVGEPAAPGPDRSQLKRVAAVRPAHRPRPRLAARGPRAAPRGRPVPRAGPAAAVAAARHARVPVPGRRRAGATPASPTASSRTSPTTSRTSAAMSTSGIVALVAITVVARGRVGRHRLASASAARRQHVGLPRRLPHRRPGRPTRARSRGSTCRRRRSSGSPGMILRDGVDALWYPVGFAAGYLALVFFVAPRCAAPGAYTVPDFAVARLNSRRPAQAVHGLRDRHRLALPAAPAPGRRADADHAHRPARTCWARWRAAVVVRHRAGRRHALGHVRAGVPVLAEVLRAGRSPRSSRWSVSSRQPHASTAPPPPDAHRAHHRLDHDGRRLQVTEPVSAARHRHGRRRAGRTRTSTWQPGLHSVAQPAPCCGSRRASPIAGGRGRAADDATGLLARTGSGGRRQPCSAPTRC